MPAMMTMAMVMRVVVKHTLERALPAKAQAHTDGIGLLTLMKFLTIVWLTKYLPGDFSMP